MALLLLVIVVAIGLAFFATPLWAWFVVGALFLLGCGASYFWFVPLPLFAVVFLHKATRVKLITSNLFKFIEKKGLLPKISDTEKIALRAGDVWVESIERIKKIYLIFKCDKQIIQNHIIFCNFQMFNDMCIFVRVLFVDLGGFLFN